MSEMQMICRLFAAKTGENCSNTWLSVKTHLEDTAAVIKLLAERIPDAVVSATGMERMLIKRILIFLAFVHDIGKCTTLFQNTITATLPEVRERLEQAGIHGFNNGRLNPGKSPHALAGGCILALNGCPICLTEIIAAHHGKPQEADEDAAQGQMTAYMLNYYDERNPETWSTCWLEIMRCALEKSGFASIEDLPQELSVQAQMLFSGILIMADWIASNQYYFPLIPVEKIEPDIAEEARAKDAWKRLALPECWQTMCFGMEDETFADRFGFFPNEMQRTVLDRIANAANPGIVMLEAQMGVGKTEAALGAAEILAAQHGSGGLFFGLPTHATANGIFPRLEKWAEDQSQDTVHAIRLAHGMAELNEEYLRLAEGSAATSEDEESGGLIVHRWFNGKKQALLAEFVIGTVDQLLMAALKRRHIMLRHLGLAGKVVIIDECHAYDAYMSHYLDRTLTWLGSYHVPVIILSATLPAKRRTELICAYLGRKIKKSDQSWSSTRSYPLLTWTDGQEVFQEKIPYTGNEKNVSILRIADCDMCSYLLDALRDGGCAGVIVNTVNRAQRFAKQLAEQIPDAEIFVFHAGFLFPDRAEKEKKLLTRLGKGSTPESRNRLIVVGTQVLEQSLDIDFDLMVTDLCPMDLLLQRVGRLHRHDRTRPVKLRNAICVVLSPEDNTFEKGAEAIYGAWLLQRTKEMLPEQIALPQDIPHLVQDAYAEELNETEHTAELEQLQETYLREIKNRWNKAGAYCVDAPRDKHFWHLIDADIGNTDARAEAAVRDGDPSIEVLLLVEQDESHVCFLPWQYNGAEVLLSHVPSAEECRRIARQRIRLPYGLCTRGRIESTIKELEERTQRKFAEWQQAPILRGELILLLRPDLSAVLSSFRLQYTKENGLEYDKEDDG